MINGHSTLNAEQLRINYASVRARISAAERCAGRAEGSVCLVAVSKTHPAQAIRSIAGLGQRDFAENFVQEALDKQCKLEELDIEWHFIGRIQSNKTRDIAQKFSWAHGVDRYKIARRLNDQRDPDQAPLNICIQVNLQGEQTKSGVCSGDLSELADQICELPRVSLRGLMIIPEFTENADAQRTVFAQLRDTLDLLNRQGHALDTLSMGMTGDMESAILEGATHVRVGTAVFGHRLPDNR